MEFGKSVERYLATNLYYILPTALAWTFFIEVFKQVLKNQGYVDSSAKAVEKLFRNNIGAVAAAAIVFLGIAYVIVFRSSNDSFLDFGLIIVVGFLSITMFAVTRRSSRIAAMFGTGSWFETALTAWMMMLLALFVVFSTLALARRWFV